MYELRSNISTYFPFAHNKSHNSKWPLNNGADYKCSANHFTNYHSLLIHKAKLYLGPNFNFLRIHLHIDVVCQAASKATKPPAKIHLATSSLDSIQFTLFTVLTKKNPPDFIMEYLLHCTA